MKIKPDLLIYFAAPQIIIPALTIGMSKYPIIQTVQLLVGGTILLIALFMLRAQEKSR